MTDADAGAQCAAILQACQYANIATCQGEQPWNTPATVMADEQLDLYWSSWIKAVHSQNIHANPNVFLTFYDSTRARGSNNRQCLYLRCTAEAVSDQAEARKAHALIYPQVAVELDDFLEPGPKRFYRARPQQAWLNVLSERDLTPDTVKMRREVALASIRI
ncbi:MAG TPA: pyridoxamine 5'-phosphate oxidase family protein [Salinisphaeraceae bacterium]|nr:pyridoxamine 5'-phosphate oxidase family protein [Salinisphaeraceae bacterium]